MAAAATGQVANVVNAVVQVLFYQANEPVVLGIAHIATGPVFATIAAVTPVFRPPRRTLGPDTRRPHRTYLLRVHRRAPLTTTPTLDAATPAAVISTSTIARSDVAIVSVVVRDGENGLRRGDGAAVPRARRAHPGCE